jgi:hypothetical protein
MSIFNAGQAITKLHGPDSLVTRAQFCERTRPRLVLCHGSTLDSNRQIRAVRVVQQ